MQMNELSDWEKLKEAFARDFPEEYSKKACSSCVYSTWTKIDNVEHQAFVPYCSKLNFVLKTLVEADDCAEFVLK